MDIAKHLQARGLDISLYSWVSIFDDVALFWLWNLSGQLVGYQQYRPEADKQAKNDPRDGRYYTSIHGDKYSKPLAVWGLESLDYRSDVLVISEGIFDACQFHNIGVPCVAVLSSSAKPLRNWLWCLNREIYQAIDREGSKLGQYKTLHPAPGYSDFGEMPLELTKQIWETRQ